LIDEANMTSPHPDVSDPGSGALPADDRTLRACPGRVSFTSRSLVIVRDISEPECADAHLRLGRPGREDHELT